jgi:hypothetical protein
LKKYGFVADRLIADDSLSYGAVAQALSRRFWVAVPLAAR